MTTDREKNLLIGEQRAFSEAYDLIKRLLPDEHYPDVEVGGGVFTPPDCGFTENLIRLIVESGRRRSPVWPELA
jgi:hypothetical protein